MASQVPHSCPCSLESVVQPEGMMVMRLFTLNSQAPCWLRIRTKTPKCVYFFGPFDSPDEARDHQDGYITDLTQEGAQGIQVTLQSKEPKELTVVKELNR